jgi:phosphoribosyl-ATP pyrophosphohydrolase/phosphoribosyl-AMP cyclohydrolase
VSDSQSDGNTLRAAVRFDENGLIPAVAQDALTGEIRMLAYMNDEALRATLATGAAHFYSRSRRQLWKKGETSGHVLAVRALFLDCDGDAIVLHVEPEGPTCHTGAPSCFFRKVEGDELRDGARPVALAERLESTLEDRKKSTAERSYTRSLLEAGATKIGAKLREEADELARAIASEPEDRVASEAADVIYHLFVALVHRGVSWRSVLAELSRRFGTSGHVEKASRGSKDEHRA